jgi:DNA anti-recombination protein RmuC
MNAIRATYEAGVLTNETIEVHLHYLRSGFDVMQAALPVLRDKIDAVSARLDAKIDNTDAKIDAVNASLSARIDALSTSVSEKTEKTNTRIDAVSTSLGEKIDKTNAKIDAVNTSLGEKIDAVNTSLTEKMTTEFRNMRTEMSVMRDSIGEIKAFQKALLWVVGGLGTLITLSITVAKAFHWI